MLLKTELDLSSLFAFYLFNICIIIKLSQKNMSNCQKEVKPQKLLKYKPYKSNFELSSKWIFTKNPNPGKKIFWSQKDGGGDVEGRGWGAKM